MSKFKVGDKVRCVDNGDSFEELVVGKEYAVDFTAWDEIVRLEGDLTWWSIDRFELVEDKVKEEMPPIYNDMTEEERVMIATAFARGKQIQAWRELRKYWYDTDSLVTFLRLRIKPEEPTADSLDWSHVTFNYAARDENGKGFGYVHEPNKCNKMWIGVGSICNLRHIASYKQGNLPWDQSLICRPGFEVEE